MRSLPESIGPIHFVGIGGIGMSGIAEVLHNLGYRVQGSDLADSANTRRLAGLGIAVKIGHRAENLDSAEVIVVSSAVKPDNPELVAARARRLPVVRRAEMLAELMRLKWSIAIAGTHGKTTTTSMLGALLETAGLDPTVINGGIINAYGTNTRLGAGDWMAVEADESDGTFTRLPATVAIVTNIDPEHLDFYGDFTQLQQAFEIFVGNIPFYGFAVLCIDHPVVQGMIARLSERRILTYGLSPQADIRATNIRLGPEGSHYDAVIADRVTGGERVLPGLFLPMFGEHNVQNSLTVLAVAEEMGLGDEVVRASLRDFKGVRRRFTKTGEWNGVPIIDDYGHHPVEIAAVLKAARAIVRRDERGGRVIAVVQPHRYTRLANLFDGFCRCFNDADLVLVADVYAAGEAPIEGASRDALVTGLSAHGHRNAQALPRPEHLAPLLRDLARPGDMVVCLGAGSITNWANSLPDELAKLDARSRVA
jgi:UDP-N-acetylmuramate--alanine ligase